MNCNWVRERLSSYVDGMLDEHSLETIESHVHECPSCKAELELLKKMLATVSSVSEVEPPTDLRAAIMNSVNATAREECERVEMLLSEFVDGVISDTDRCLVEKHLAACSDCSYQLAALTNAVELARSVEQVEPPANLRERILSAVEAIVNRGPVGRVLDRMGELLVPAPARWAAAAAVTTAAIVAAVAIPFHWEASKAPVAKAPVSVQVRERSAQPPVVVAKTPGATVAAAPKFHRPRVSASAKIENKQLVAAKAVPASGKLGAQTMVAKAAEADKIAAKASVGVPEKVIAEQVKETVAKVNTEIATEATKPEKEDQKVLKIAVARQKPTDQVFTFEDLKQQLTSQKKPEQKPSVTLIGAKF